MERADSDAQRTRRIATWVVLVLASIGAIIHQLGPSVQVDGWTITRWDWRLWDWYTEDAAISFSYARNWAEGDGLVAFPGGERLEGYSNPTWVALMALFHLVGIDGWTSSKFMAMFFSIGSLFLVYKLTEEVVDDRDSWAPQIAPILLAASPTFAFYNAAGLENSIFTFLLAGGIWRTVVEGKQGGVPWAAVWYLLLACSRPDGIMYAALGGFVWMVLSVANGRGIKPTMAWLAVFFVPFLAYNAVRYAYFGYTFPMTYYAKLGVRSWTPFAWGGGGWKYLRNYGWDTGMAWFVPLILSGVVGLRNGRWAWVLFGSLVYGFAIAYPNADFTKDWAFWPADMPNPSWWNEARVWSLLAGSLIMAVVALGDRRSAGRILSFGSLLLVVLFIIRARGDWMNGFRWMAMAQAPLTLLLAVGIDEVASLLQRLYGKAEQPGWTTPGWLGASLVTLAMFPGYFDHSEYLIRKREIGPYSVKRRVMYTDFLTDRVWMYDMEIDNLEVDMGAHLWWTKHRMIDMAGLVDIPVAQSTWGQRKFAEHYVYEERPPAVAHLHGGWASKTRLKTYPMWEKGWVPLPGYPVSRRTYHTGNFMRRDLIMADAWTGPGDRRVAFERGIALEGFDVPSPETAAGGGLYLEVGVSYRQPDDKEDFRLLAFLSDDAGHLHSFDVPLGYDWVPPSEWRMEEAFHGKFAFPLPQDLPAGRYDLGFVLVGGDGAPIPVAMQETEEGVRPEAMPAQAVLADGELVPARFARGEVRFPGVVEIGAPGADVAAAEADRDAAIAEAKAGRCDEAVAAWEQARFHLPLQHDAWDRRHADVKHVEYEEPPQWWELHRPGAEISRCYAARAEQVFPDDAMAAVAALREARIWDFREPVYVRVAAQVGDALYARGMEAYERGAWEESYDLLHGAITAKPWHSWARKHAEEARHRMLGLIQDDDPALAKAEVRKRQLLEARKKAAARKRLNAQAEDEGEE